MPDVNISIEIDLGDVARAEAEQLRQLEAGLNTGMDKILTRLELLQIHKYLTNQFPPLPAGSDYQRTFTLRDASRTKRTGETLPNIGGEWWVDEGAAPYGEYVLGPRARQAAIHQDRWLSEEETAAETEKFAPQIIEQELARRGL